MRIKAIHMTIIELYENTLKWGWRVELFLDLQHRLMNKHHLLVWYIGAQQCLVPVNPFSPTCSQHTSEHYASPASRIKHSDGRFNYGTEYVHFIFVSLNCSTLFIACCVSVSGWQHVDVFDSSTRGVPEQYLGSSAFTKAPFKLILHTADIKP